MNIKEVYIVLQGGERNILICTILNFGDSRRMSSSSPYRCFHQQEDFLFRGNQLCIPHDRCLVGHFGKDRTLALVKQILY